MIERINITHFKCLDRLELPLAGITVLAGLNGMGKSTLIQSLLLLQQSATELTPPLFQLMRNGPMVELGTAKDLLWEGADDETISFAITSTDETSKWTFKLDRTLGEFVADPVPDTFLPANSGLFSERFEYLRADRWGPRTSLPISNSEVRLNHHLGRDGEFTAHYLAEFGEEHVQNVHLHHTGARSKQLSHQLEAWLGEISPGTRLYAEAHHALDLISLSYAFATGRGETNHYRATNVGFGISYVLPIIVAALASPPGTLLMVENPEAHLHPRGQRKMGEILGLASLGGVQIIVETHSDHFLNGLRLAVHGGLMAPENIALHFFERETEGDAIRAKITSPVMDTDGRIDHWPDGFFDEGEKALRELLVPTSSA